MDGICRRGGATLRFDLLSLQLFVAVCEEQSIAKAADREHIAASAVSKRISDLEIRLST
ncbi:LysR family transcriptional regulator, partial [Mesorhizobium sp. M7A.F.Ca.CA.004.05.1.1]